MPHKFILLDVEELIQDKSKFVEIPLVKNKIKSTINVIYSYKNNKIELTLYQTNSEIIPTKSIQKNLSNTINQVIDFFEIEDQSVFIFIALNTEKKIFPVSNIINPSNVNNGVTFFFRRNEIEEKFIFIYRFEDMYKVLIHELIHYFKKDLHHVIKNNHPLMSMFNIRGENGEITLTEAYTETLACFIYATRIVKKTDFKTVLDYYRNRLLRIAKAQVEHCKKYKIVEQESHMFSYYICRGLLFADIDRFLILFINKDRIGLENLIIRNYNFLETVKPLRIMHI
jgi:hypothetical protein